MSKNRDKIIVAVIVVSVVFLFFVFSGILIGLSRSAGGVDLGSLGGRVALVDVKGEITSSEDIVRQVKKYQNDGSVKALVLRVDTPGGGVAASQEIYDQLLKFRDSGKSIVVSMGSVAASGGYYIACAADSIVANPGTVIGSIGVMISFPVFERLMDKIGVKMEVIKSGDLKDVGNYARQMTSADKEMLQALIEDSYDQFVNVVAESRDLEVDSVRGFANGSVFTGRQAMQLGLIDRLGTMQDAIAVAGEMADLGDDPRTVKERLYRRSWWDLVVRFLGLDSEFLKAQRSWPYLEYMYGY
jgi:protease-4